MRSFTAPSLLDAEGLARRTGLSARRVGRALAVLAADGRVGYDLFEGAYFHRELPDDSERVLRDNPRLRSAHKLARNGAVRPFEGGAGRLLGDGRSRRVRRAHRPAQLLVPLVAAVRRRTGRVQTRAGRPIDAAAPGAGGSRPLPARSWRLKGARASTPFAPVAPRAGLAALAASWALGRAEARHRRADLLAVAVACLAYFRRPVARGSR